jgi:MFS superfamily sulfate permease-like transporter
VWERPFIKQKSWSTYLPGPLIVVFMGILLNEVFRMTGLGYLSATDGHLVQLPIATNWSELSTLSVLPDFSAFLNPQVYLVGLTIAIVGSLETLLSIEASDKLDPFKRISNTNRELLAQGSGNILSGFMGGLPITSVIVRSSTNVYSGGRTKSSAIIHGIILLVSALAIPFLLNLIPLASLAAILLIIGYKLARISLFKSMFKAGDAQFIPFVVTVLTIVFTDLLTGIIVGLLVGFYYIIRNNYHEPIITVYEDENFLIRFTKDMSFINKITLKKHLRNIPDNSNVIIDGTKSIFIDDDIFEVVQDFKENAAFRGINVQCSNFDTKKRAKKNKLIK